MKKALYVLFVAIFLLSSCAVLDRTPSIYYNEEELSLEDITEMRHSVESPEETQPTLSLVPYSQAPTAVPVYWNANGNVWHLNTECGYLNRDGDIIFGSTEEAIKSGKVRVCSPCEKKK